MNAPDPRTVIDVEAHRKSRTSRLLLPILTIVLAGAAFALWKSSNKTHLPHSPLEPRPATSMVPVDKPMTVARAAASKTLPQAGNADLPQPAGTTQGRAPAAMGLPGQVGAAAALDVPPPSSGVMAAIFERFTKIDGAIENLRAEVAKINAVNVATAPAKVVDADAVATPAAHRPSRHKSRRIDPRRERAPATAAVPASGGPDVLSVDTWNGRTSVAVRTGGGVSFMSEGDHVGSYELKRADKESQRAFFVDPAGKLLVKDREARQ